MISDTDPNFAAYYEAMHRRSILLVVAVALLAACSNAASNSALPHSTESVSTSAEVSTTAATLATADTAATALTNTTVAASAPTSAAPTTTAKPKAKLKPSAPTTTSTVAPGPYTSAIYADPAHWICRGDVTNDVCDSSYPVTAVAADGTLTINPSDKAADPPIDCFYVYPTSSEDTTMASDFTAGAEVTTTILQAARFNQVCRVFAPIYRSVTNAGLSRAFSAGDPQFAGAWNQAYLDVLDAWRQYLAHDNNGRPVVIIAHSQGSFHVVRLLKEEIDPKPEQRSLIVSAIVAGTSFQVATGRDVGGDTQNMPLCHSNTQFGCIITFQTFRDSVPPQPGSLFGAPGSTTDSACTNPAALAGGPALLDAAAPTGPWIFASTYTGPTITTRFMSAPGLVTGECKVLNGYHYLAVTINADPTDARADDIRGDSAPNWGLHAVDLNLSQDSLIAVVRSQAAAYPNH
jgi:hypothetical protein